MMLEETFLQHIAENQKILHKVCFVYRNTEAEREDLFQDILYQLWKSWSSFKGESRFSTWMYKIALSTAIARYRVKKEQFHQQHLPIEIAPEIGEEDHRDELERLHVAIQTLNEIEKSLVSLYLEGFSYEEMAEIIGISSSHVGVKLNRIKQKLKQRLTK